MNVVYKPVANRGLASVERGGTLVLYLAGASQAVELNATAARIWRCCDGTRTVADIAESIASELPDRKEDVRRDVADCIRRLETVNAVVTGDPRPPENEDMVWPVPSSIAFTVDGLGAFHGFEGDHVTSIIAKNKVWESYLHPVFEKYVSPGDTVLDAGCYIGTHTIKLARLCAPGSVLAFEPHPDICRVAHTNCDKNGIANVRLFERGLSDRPGEVRYGWFRANNLSASGLEDNPQGSPGGADAVRASQRELYVSLMTVDDLQLERLAFMKVDVEGYEIKVLRGAAATLARCRPVIVIECWKSHFLQDVGLVEDLDSLTPDSPLQFLKDRGYTIEPIAGPDFLALPSGS